MEGCLQTNCGLFKPTIMFFGLTNSPATFQTIMDKLFKEELVIGNIVIYMDDILIAIAGTLDTYKQKDRHVLQKLMDNNLFLKLEKCQFHQRKVEYLRVILGNV